MRKTLKTLLILLLACAPAWGATYYVRSDGADGSAGTTDSAAGAWATVAKVNASSFSAGDIIQFRRGDTWREQLTMPSSGTAIAPIVVRSYGTGADPIISGMMVCDQVFQVPVAGHSQSHGFEDGTDGYLTATNATIDTWVNIGKTGPATGGDDGCKVDPNLAISNLVYDLGANYREAWIEMDVRSLDSGAAANRMHILTFEDEDGTAFLSIRHTETTKKLRAISLRAGTPFLDEATAPADDTWYKLKVQVITGSDGLTAVRCWRDGTLVIPQSGAATLTALGTKQIRKIYVGWTAQYTTGQPCYADNVRFSRANFDAGAGLYTHGTANGVEANGRQFLWVDGEEYGDPEAALADVNAAGEWYFDATTGHAYWFSDLSGSTVELPNRDACLQFNGQNYVQVSGLDLLGASDTNISTHLISAPSSTDSTGIEVRDCTIRHALGGGISLYYLVKRANIQDNTIHHCGHAGMFVNGATAGSAFPVAPRIVGNTIYECWRQGITLELCTDAEISWNKISAIHSDASYGRGIELQGAAGATGAHGTAVITHNTVADCEEACIYLGYGNAFVRGIVTDNLVYATGTGSGIYCGSGGRMWLLDYNLYWHAETAGLVFQYGAGTGFTRAQLASIQARSSADYEVHGVAGNPRLLSTTPGASGFLCVKGDSPAVGAASDGTNMGADQSGAAYGSGTSGQHRVK